MASTINADDGVISGIAGVKTTADSTGALNIQTNGTTAISISATQAVSLTNSPTFTGGTANGVLFLNASKVATSGTALVFDGTNLSGTGSIGTTIASKTAQFDAAGGSIYASFADGTKTWRFGAGIQSAGTVSLYNVTNAVTAFTVDATGNLGIGTASPLSPLDIVVGASGARRVLVNYDDSIITIKGASNTAAPETLRIIADNIRFNTGTTGSGTERARITAAGEFLVGTTSANTFSGYSTVQLGQSTSGSIINFQGGATSTSSAAHIRLDCSATTVSSLTIETRNQAGTASTPIIFKTQETERVRITAGGDLLVGTTLNNSYKAHIAAGDVGNTVLDGLAISNLSNAGGSGTGVRLLFKLAKFETAVENRKFAAIEAISTASNGEAIALSFYVQNSASAGNPVERARLTSGGIFLVGKTSSNILAAGVELQTGGDAYFTAPGPLQYLNRTGTDGTLVEFRQDNTTEGSISVSGTTVSYNGGHLSRWSQMADNTRIPLLKGTVMTNLDQMAIWEKDGQPLPNEQLNCMKVSDVEGDVNVAGVFVNWDNDDDVFTNDMNIAMTGDMIIRIAQGVVVQRGELLMSAGDGTAKPQGDDIIRSKTVAKVTSNHVTCTYDDGSYCVPCVLTAC